ncbi:MAG: putative zinc-binding protein [Acidobacteriia bacterium]|nr:putative zinc-binding protein [Terriglobia bacterium]
MPDLTKKKVGIVTCSGEEIPEGTVTRRAALKVLESLRPHQTVTICLPLFLAGGEGDRAFARFHPTIAVDGCEKRCAARSTERYSGKPAVSIVVEGGASKVSSRLGTARRLTETGMSVANDVASEIARHVDRLLGLHADERPGLQIESSQQQEEPKARGATCSCGSGIPVTTLRLAGREVTFVGLPLIFAEFREAGRLPDDCTKAELMAAVRIYNPFADDDAASYTDLVLQEYRAYCERSH